MIFDKIVQLNAYACVHPQISAAITFLEATDINTLEVDEKYPIDYSEAFVVLNAYETKSAEDCFIETHKKYVDLQVMLEGAENIGLVHLSDATVESFDEAKDVQVLQGQTQTLTFKAGEFLIFFPQDGHMPVMQVGDKPESLRKLVFKLLVDA